MKIVGSGSLSEILHDKQGRNVEVLFCTGENPHTILGALEIQGGNFGNFVLKNASSESLQGLNSRILSAVLQQDLENLLSPYVSSFNDEITRNQIANTLDDHLSELAAKRAICNSWRIICDETNNSPSVIDSHRLNVTIYFQPNKTAEVIKIDISIGG